ncbi:thiamine pyrophosphate-binding protein [Sphingomonas sp.]|uniref:thiamine pyrophosphate-binding protein n=1 Tax=Sphingomonas sp. TaxID=28214 RepID=UPI002FCB6E0F
MSQTVATNIAHTLKECGVEHFFMLTGGDQPLWIALRDAGIRMIVARSEPGAVYMADGYARAADKVAVTYGQAGPGAANVAAALADSYWAQSPVFALTGATATNAVHVNEYQALDQNTMFGPVTKWNGAAEEPGQVAPLLRQALTAAVSPTRGPTHLDVPKNFFAMPGTSEGVEGKGPLPSFNVQSPHASEVTAALKALRDAKRPMILVGEGVRLSGAGEAVARFADLAGIPLVATMGGKPAVLSACANFCGIVGRYSSVTANRLMAQADCVLALGTRLGGLSTNGYSLPSRKANVIQVDQDITAFANPYAPESCIRADIAAFMETLLTAQGSAQQGEKSEWLGLCQRESAAWLERFARHTASAASQAVLSPVSVLEELSRYGSEITVVADTGYMAAWTGVLFPTLRYNSFFRAVGSLGWALPASLGVQMARPEKVVCITGDGGAGYHLADIETAVRYKIPVVILVFNNNGLAFEYHEQKYRWNGNVVAEANDFTASDFALAAKALGATGLRATNRQELSTALAKGIASDHPCVIDVVIDREAFPPVTNFDAVFEREL